MSLKKYILLISGTIALLFGVIGALIPVLPTTPFLLIAAYCYLRSSKRLYNKLINHKIIGKYILLFYIQGGTQKIKNRQHNFAMGSIDSINAAYQEAVCGAFACCYRSGGHRAPAAAQKPVGRTGSSVPGKQR